MFPRRIVVPIASLLLSVPAWAQDSGTDAPAPNAGNMAAQELPEVVVTSPSPIAKPAVKRKRAVKKPAPIQAAAPTPKPKSQASQAAAPAEPEPVNEVSEIVAPTVLAETPPGTLLVDDEAFVPVTVTTEQEIRATQGPTITDALQNKPGISSTSFAPGANRPIIRGLDSYRVRVQENGIGSGDVSSLSEDHAVPIDPYSAERIEVVRGPATLRYGSGSIGGVVAVENGRIPVAIPEGGVSGAIQGGISSVDEGRDGAFRVTGGGNGVAIHADAFKRHADDYDTPAGRQSNSFANSEGGAVGVSFIGDEGFIGVSVSQVTSLYGIPGEEAEEGFDPRIDLEQQKIQARGEWRPNAMGVQAVRFWFGASDYAHDELERHAHEEDEHEDEDHNEDHAEEDAESEFEIGSRFTNREQEGRLEVQHLPTVTSLGELTGAIGVQYLYRKTRGQSFEGESLLEPARTNSLAAFWFEELAVSRTLKFQAATRIEHTTVDGRGWSDFVEGGQAGTHGLWFATPYTGERSFAPLSGSLGLVQKLPFDVSGRLTAQYSERAPDAAELFSKGGHHATSTFEVGNPFLGKEKAFTVEAGLAKASGPFRFDATAFHTSYRGFIYRQLAGAECEGAAHEGHYHCEEHEGGDHDGHEAEGEHAHAFDLVFFRQRDARFYGVELAAQYDIAPIWNGVWGIDGRYDFVHARFEGSENVPRIPPHRLGGGLYYRDANWFARTGVLHAFDQDEIGLNEIETPGYTLVSAELSYTAVTEGLGRVPQEFTIGVRGENLADDEVLNHASFQRRQDVLLPGASVRLFGTLKFN
jgi:iron complex outermembrane receptor protein